MRIERLDLSKHTLNTAIIGTGIGQVLHAPVILKHPDFDLSYIVGQDLEKTKEVADKLGVDHSIDWMEVIADDEIDVVSICTPPYLHKEMALAALDHGKHVICEKPLAVNAADALEMYEKAEDAGLIAFVNFEFRYLPERVYFNDLIKSGYIGDIQELDIRLRSGRRLNPRKFGYNWWSETSKGGGLLNTVGSHYIDFIGKNLGEINEVVGNLFTNIPKRLNKETGRMKKVNSDDAFSCILRSEKGISNITMNATTPFGAGTIIEAIGSEGTLLIHDDLTLLGGRLVENSQLEPIIIPESYLLQFSNDQDNLINLMAPFYRLLDDFSNSVQQGKPIKNAPTFMDGYRVQIILDAIHLSSKKNQVIEIS